MSSNNNIHPTALVSDGAQIADDAIVGPFAIIGPDVTIGQGTEVKANAIIEGKTTIGKNNTIHSFAVIGGIPQDLKFKGEQAELLIGDENKIREYVTIHIGTEGGAMKTIVGNRNLFMASSHVAHDCIIGDNNVFANSCALAGHVEIGDNAILGGMTGVHQFSCVGDYTMIGAGSMVGQDVPPFSIAQGDRCRLRGVNLLGLKRNGFSGEDSSKIKRAWRSLFLSSGKTSEKVDALPEELRGNPNVELLVSFLNRSISEGRGVCSPD